MVRSQRPRKECKIDEITWKTFATELSARKNEFRLQFQAPTLGIVWRIERGKVYVAEFADFNGVVLPAQSCCMIGIGDELIMVDRIPLQKMDLVEKTDLLSHLDQLTQNGVELTFRYGRTSDIIEVASHKRVSLDGRLKHDALFDFLDDDGFIDPQSLDEDKLIEELTNDSKSTKFEDYDLNIEIGKQELQKRLLELDQLQLSLSIPRSQATKDSNFICQYWSQPENESLLSILGDKLDSWNVYQEYNDVIKKTELATLHSIQHEREGKENQVINIPFLWETDDTVKLQSFYGDNNRELHMASPTSTSTITSSSLGPRTSSKYGSKGKTRGREMPLLSSSLLLRRHFRHELITLTHDTIDQLLRQDSDDMIRTVHNILTRLGVPWSTENSENDNEQQQDVVVSRNQYEEKKATIENDTQQNLLYSLFTGLATAGPISTVLSTFHQTDTSNSSPNLLRKSSLLVQEVSTQCIFSIPALEATYSLFYTVLQQLPTFQSISCHHDSSCGKDSDCLLCLLLRWSNSFDSSALWDAYQHRIRQNSFFCKDETSSNQKTYVKNDRNVLVQFVTSLNDRGEVVSIRHEDRVDITHYLEIIRDLLTLTVCLLLSEGDLLVFDARYPFNTISSSTHHQTIDKNINASLSTDAFVKLPLRLHLHPSRSSFNNNHDQTHGPGEVIEFVEKHRGLLHMQLLITAAIRLQHTSLLRKCLIDTEELLFAEQQSLQQNNRRISNSMQLSESCQRMLRYLLRPVASANISLTTTWTEVFDLHLLPALDAIGCYGSRVNDWKYPIFLWLLQQLIHQPPSSQQQETMENAQDTERQHVLFLSDLCLIPEFCTYTTPFALCRLFFPQAANFNEFIKSADNILLQLIGAKQCYDAGNMCDGSQEEKGVKENEEEGGEGDDDSEEEESVLMKQWAVGIHPALSRYHHFLTRYMRVMAREEDVLSSVLHHNDNNFYSLLENGSFQEHWMLDVDPGEVTIQLLHVTLLLARYDTWSCMRDTQQPHLQQSHSLHKQTTRWSKKNKYLVGVRSLLRKIHRPPSISASSTTQQSLSPYVLDPLVAGQLCLRFSFLEGVYTCLDMLGDEERNKQTHAECVVRAAHQGDSLWCFFEKIGSEELAEAADLLTSTINDILRHDSHRWQTHHQRFNQTVSGQVLHDVVNVIQLNMTRYINYLMRFYSDAEESVFLQAMRWIGKILNHLVKLSMDILHPEVFLRSSHDCDTVGDTGTVTQFLAEWSVFVLLNCFKSSMTRYKCDHIGFINGLMNESSVLMEWMSVEYILYLRQEGFSI